MVNLKFLKQNVLTILIILALAVLVGVGAARFTQRQSGFTTSPKSSPENLKIVSEESVVIDVVKKASPSVASIAIERRLLNPFGPFEAPAQTQSGIGTGFVIAANGLILTNKHVVNIPGKYFVVLKDGKAENKFEVRQIHRDPFNDLAILKIDPTAASGQVLKPLDLGDSSKLQVGQKVIAIGNALGRLDNTVTTGVISGLGRGITPFDPSTGTSENLQDVIQTDAAINPGNSGGPLLNTAAQVIGINVAQAGAENIGFATPINLAKQLISDFEKTGKISRPFLGVRYNHISKDVALLNNVPEGEFIQEVVDGSAASDAGMRAGDIIIEVDGVKLTEGKSLQDIIRGKKVGEQLRLKIFRDNKTLDITATLEEAPTE